MKLKQMMLVAASLLVSASGFADTYAVWPAATDGEVQIPNEFNGWHNFNYEVQSIDGMEVTKCWKGTANSNASSGWMTSGAQGFDYAVLADKDLNFEAKIEGPGQWNVRLTASGVESDVTIEIPRDGTFHHLTYNVAELWPGVAQKWSSGAANGNDIFTFSLVGTDLTDESAIYFTNVRYKEAISKPALSAEVKDITDTSATLTWAATFPEGYTNTKVIVNDVEQTVNSMDITGLNPHTSYSYTITAEGELDGQTYSTTKVVTFKTERTPGTVPVWYGITDIPGFFADYSITYNEDKTLTVNAYFESEKPTVVADRNFHIYIGGDEWLKLYDDGTGTLTGTTKSTFEEGATITWEWYLPIANGLYQEVNQYVIGSENEAPLSIRVKASAENVTFESAEIAYTVSAPAGSEYKVYYAAKGSEAVEATESPIVLTGLDENTEYIYEVYAVLGKGEDAVESVHEEVSFKTTHKGAVDLVYSDFLAAEFKNAFLEGETEINRRSIFATIPWKVTYKADGTAVYTIDLSAVKNIVGLVPQIWWDNFRTLTADENGIYEYNFGAQELEATTAISHYLAYSGGVIDIRSPYTNWGMEHEAPAIGEAVGMTLSSPKPAALTEEPIQLSVSAKDANGLYLPIDNVTYEVEGRDYQLVNGLFIAKDTGEYTIKATAGNLHAEVKINIIAHDVSTNLLAGKVGVTDEKYIQGGQVEFVTDNDLTSQLEWICRETAEHYLIYDLGVDYHIEGIDVLFEGAFAKKFTVTLTNTRPAELGNEEVVTFRPSLTAEGDEETQPAADVVFSNTEEGTQHYFTKEPFDTHRYVVLNTSEALNNEWGIKLRDLKVYGMDEDVMTGVEGVNVDNSNAPVEYFNLQGVRVANPDAGIYIRRQGSETVKVIIR